MENLTIKALNSMVDKIIKDHQSEITEMLFSGGTHEMSKEEVFDLMTLNCLSFFINEIRMGDRPCNEIRIPALHDGKRRESKEEAAEKLRNTLFN